MPSLSSVPAAPETLETLTLCPLCENPFSANPQFHVVHGWTIVECPVCRVGVTAPRPLPEYIGAYYKSSFFSVRPDAKLIPSIKGWLRKELSTKQMTGTARSIVLNEIKYQHDRTLQGSRLRRCLFAPFRWVLALCYEPVQTLPSKPGRILDVGFGRGEFLLRAKRLGWDTYGVEVSDTSVAWGRSLGFKAETFDGSFKSPLPYPDGYFDVVSANSVLEHVHDPKRMMAECRRLLKPGGRILVIVPNFACRDIEILGEHWRMWSPPQHLFHFRAENVRDLLFRSGFGEPQVRFKVWFNPQTDRQSLDSIRRAITPQRFRQIAWNIRFGKRIAYLLGRRSAEEVAPGMAIEAVAI